MKKILILLFIIAISVTAVNKSGYADEQKGNTTITNEEGEEIPEIETDEMVEDDPDILVDD